MLDRSQSNPRLTDNSLYMLSNPEFISATNDVNPDAAETSPERVVREESTTAKEENSTDEKISAAEPRIATGIRQSRSVEDRRDPALIDDFTANSVTNADLDTCEPKSENNARESVPKILSKANSFIETEQKLIEHESATEIDRNHLIVVWDSMMSSFQVLYTLFRDGSLVFHSKFLRFTALTSTKLGKTKASLLESLMCACSLSNKLICRTRICYRAFLVLIIWVSKTIIRMYFKLRGLMCKRVIPQSKVCLAVCCYNLVSSFVRIMPKWDGEMRIGTYLFTVKFLEEHVSDPFFVHDLLCVPRDKLSL